MQESRAITRKSASNLALAFIMPSSIIARATAMFMGICAVAFLPLFTMKGPEGQIFGPMAETYAFALAGALLLAVTPVRLPSVVKVT